MSLFRGPQAPLRPKPPPTASQSKDSAPDPCQHRSRSGISIPNGSQHRSRGGSSIPDGSEHRSRGGISIPEGSQRAAEAEFFCWPLTARQEYLRGRPLSELVYS